MDSQQGNPGMFDAPSHLLFPSRLVAAVLGALKTTNEGLEWQDLWVGREPAVKQRKKGPGFPGPTQSNWLRRCPSLFRQEVEQICVDLIFLRGTHTMGESRINLQHGSLHQFRGKHCSRPDRHNLVV